MPRGHSSSCAAGKPIPRTSSRNSPALAGAGGVTTFVDAQIIAKYLQSQQIVEDLLPTVDLRAIYSRRIRRTRYARLKDNSAIEDLAKYWNSMVSVNSDLTSGIVNVEVRAFSPEDSAKVTQAVLSASEKLVNDLSLRARNDAVRSATADVAKSETLLKQTRLQLRELARQGTGARRQGHRRERISGWSASSKPNSQSSTPISATS